MKPIKVASDQTKTTDIFQGYWWTPLIVGVNQGLLMCHQKDNISTSAPFPPPTQQWAVGFLRLPSTGPPLAAPSLS